MKKMNRKGFTIVELVIVIAVIAILAGVLIPTFSGIVTKAQDSKALQEARSDYTNYAADVDYASGAVAKKDIILETSGGKFVAVVIGEMKSTIYASADAALAAYTPSDAATKKMALENANGVEDATDGYKYYVVVEVAK